MKFIRALLNICFVVSHEIEFNQNYNVSWEVHDQAIQFTLFVNNIGSVGFGINSRGSMHDAEMIIMGITGTDCEYNVECEGFITELRGRDHNGRPTVISNSIWKKISMQRTDGDAVKIIIERPVNPDKCTYISLSTSTIRLLWSLFDGPAVEITNESLMSYHSARRGSKTTHLLDHAPKTDPPNCNSDNTYCKDYTVVANLTPQRTQYWCKFVELTSEDSQMIGFELIYNNSKSYLHHALMYACERYPSEFLNRAEFQGDFACGDYRMSFLQTCFEAIAIAAVGSTGFDFPSKAGYPIGPSSSNWALLEVHYDNPAGDTLSNMRSGLRLKYTTVPREFEAGHISLGATWMFYLPPQQEHIKLYGACYKECLQSATGNNDYEINIFAASSHGHMYTNSIQLSKVQNREEVQRIVDEPFYDRFYQEYKYLEEEVQVGPSDDLVVTCDYTTADTWVRGGLEQTNEMCYVFALYYPRIKDISFCTSMTSYEDVFDYFNVKNATANYGEIGRPEEIMVQTDDGSMTGEAYFNEYHGPDVTRNNMVYGTNYENFLRLSSKIPMCTASSGNVFSLDNGQQIDPVPEPEGGLILPDNNDPVPEPEGDPYLGSHMTDKTFDAVIFTSIHCYACDILQTQQQCHKQCSAECSSIFSTLSTNIMTTTPSTTPSSGKNAYYLKTPFLCLYILIVLL